MNEKTLSGPSRPPLSGGKPKQIIVFLHGVGADGENLIGFADDLAPHFPDAYFISPNGPQKYDMAPIGYQWFSLAERTAEKMLAGAKAAAPAINNFLDSLLKEFALEDKNLALVGFSQGTMMALYTGLRRNKPVAAILGYSGALLHKPDLTLEVKSKPPVALVHGTYDQVVPFAAMQHAAEQLQSIGIKAETHARPGLGHGVDQEGIKIGIEFLKKNLK